MAPNYPVILSHRRSSTVSLVTTGTLLITFFVCLPFCGQRSTSGGGGEGVGKCFFEESLTNGRCPSKLFLGRERGEKGPYRREVCKSSQIMARYDRLLHHSILS